MKPRYTVCCHDDVKSDMAELWLTSSDRDEITQACASIESSLAANPAEEGILFRAELANPIIFQHLMRRIVAVPGASPLRQLAVDPIELIFSVREDDRIVNLWFLRRVDRTDGSVFD